MKLCVRLHNGEAVTGLLRYINLSLWHIHSGGQISWSWPWSTGSINHNLTRQKWCHIELAGRSTYQSRRAQGWSDPWWLMSLITLTSTVTHGGGLAEYRKQSADVLVCSCWESCIAAECVLWRDISCKSVWKLSHKYEDNRMNPVGASKTMIRPQTCQDVEKLCLLFQKTFSMKSIVSWPLECNFSLCSFFFAGLRTLLYKMVHSPVTLPDIHSVFSFLSLFSPPTWFFFFFLGSCFVLFSHLASFHHSFSQDWRISTEAKACHTFADLRPEDDVIEMISCSISTHMAVLHSVPVLSSCIQSDKKKSVAMLEHTLYAWVSACANYKHWHMYTSTYALKMSTFICMHEYILNQNM